MKKWTIDRYAVKRLNWDNRVEYWNFWLDKWVAPEDLDDNCVTTYSTANCLQGDFYDSEIVDMKITIEKI